MIVFIVSGIGLVASYSILEFNLTVGIRNTIIILSVVASVLISWLNFNLHFNVCSSALCSLQFAEGCSSKYIICEAKIHDFFIDIIFLILLS